MPAPIAAALILRRARRLLLTLKRCVVGDGSDIGFPEKSLNNIHRCDCPGTGPPLWKRLRMSGGVPYLPHGALSSWFVSSLKAQSRVAVRNIRRGILYKPRPVWPA